MVKLMWEIEAVDALLPKETDLAWLLCPTTSQSGESGIEVMETPHDGIHNRFSLISNYSKSVHLVKVIEKIYKPLTSWATQTRSITRICAEGVLQI